MGVAVVAAGGEASSLMETRLIRSSRLPATVVVVCTTALKVERSVVPRLLTQSLALGASAASGATEAEAVGSLVVTGGGGSTHMDVELAVSRCWRRCALARSLLLRRSN